MDDDPFGFSLETLLAEQPLTAQHDLLDTSLLDAELGQFQADALDLLRPSDGGDLGGSSSSSSRHSSSFTPASPAGHGHGGHFLQPFRPQEDTPAFNLNQFHNILDVENPFADLNGVAAEIPRDQVPPHPGAELAASEQASKAAKAAAQAVSQAGTSPMMSMDPSSYVPPGMSLASLAAEANAVSVLPRITLESLQSQIFPLPGMITHNNYPERNDNLPALVPVQEPAQKLLSRNRRSRSGSTSSDDTERAGKRGGRRSKRKRASSSDQSDLPDMTGLSAAERRKLKRQRHKEIEARRRKAMNDLFNQLTLLAAPPTKQKAVVLETAAKRLRDLREQLDELEMLGQRSANPNEQELARIRQISAEESKIEAFAVAKAEPVGLDKKLREHHGVHASDDEDDEDDARSQMTVDERRRRERVYARLRRELYDPNTKLNRVSFKRSTAPLVVCSGISGDLIDCNAALVQFVLHPGNTSSAGRAAAAAAAASALAAASKSQSAGGATQSLPEAMEQMNGFSAPDLEAVKGLFKLDATWLSRLSYQSTRLLPMGLVSAPFEVATRKGGRASVTLRAWGIYGVGNQLLYAVGMLEV